MVIMDDYDAGFEAGRHDLNRIVALKEDLAYEKGLNDGYTKSIVLIRHLQRSLSTNESINSGTTLFDILNDAMELVSENLTTNDNAVD